MTIVAVRERMGLDFIAQFVCCGAASGTFPSGARLVRKLALPGVAGNNFQAVFPPSPEAQTGWMDCGRNLIWSTQRLNGRGIHNLNCIVWIKNCCHSS